MIALVGLVLLALTITVVTYPLFKKYRGSPTELAEDEPLRELHSKRDAVYSAIKELEFDFESGSLSKEDYRKLEASYKMKAISILKEIDDLEKGPRVEDEIERQVQELRQAATQAKVLFCPQCGARCQEGDRFCSQCGTSLANRRLG